jgi:hypothetical protein
LPNSYQEPVLLHRNNSFSNEHDQKHAKLRVSNHGPITGLSPDNIAAIIAATPEDNDPEEAAVWAELNAYLVNNLIDIEFPDDPRNYAEAMASPDAGNSKH